MFSVAPTLGKANVIVGAVQPVGRRLELAVAELERRPHRLQPGDVHVDRAGAEVVAAGHRQPHPAAAREQRAEHVDRRPDPLDQLVRGDRRRGRRCWQAQPAVVRRIDASMPIAASSSPMIATSTISGTLVSSYSPSARIVAAISLSTEFLAPGTSIVPCSSPTRRTRIWPPGAAVCSRKRLTTDQYAPVVLAGGHILDRPARGPRPSPHRRPDVARRPRTWPPRWPGPATTSSSSGAVARRTRSSRPRARSSPISAVVEPAGGGTCARRPRSAGRCRGSPGCSPCRCAGRSPAAGDPDPAPRRVHGGHAVVGAARPSRPAALTRARPARRGVDVRGVRQHPVHPDRELRRRRLRRQHSGVGIAGSVVRAGIVLVLPVAAVADRVGRRRMVTAMADRRPARHGRSARWRRPSRSSSPPKRSGARSGWPSTSSSRSSPPRRCRATAGPTRSACWRWPAGSAPASPSWPCRWPTSRPARGASSTSSP